MISSAYQPLLANVVTQQSAYNGHCESTSSAVLTSLPPGLATYIACSENSFRLVVNRLLRAENQAAIENWMRPPEEVADRILEDLMVTDEPLRSDGTLTITRINGSAYGYTPERCSIHGCRSS